VSLHVCTIQTVCTHLVAIKRCMAARHRQTTLFKQASEMSNLRCLGTHWRPPPPSPRAPPIRNYCRACGILAIFNLFFLYRRITSEPPGVEPCRIGLAEDKAILRRSHLKFESGARRKNQGLKTCCQPYVSVYRKCENGLIIQALLGSFMSDYKVIRTKH